MADSAYRGDQEIALDLTKMAIAITPAKSHDELLDLYNKCLKVVAESDPRADKLRQMRP